MKTIKHSENRIQETRFPKLFPLFFALGLLAINMASGAGNEIDKGTIWGKVTESGTNAPLQFAQVVLYNATDSSLVSGSITNEDGKFSIEKISSGNYYLVAEFIGYEPQMQKNIALTNENNSIEIKDIQLEEKSIGLGDINVVAQKNSMSVKADKKILNVDKNLSASGGNAIDALKISPSITVDQEGTVLLRGSSNFKVLVDGKPSVLKSNEALKQMPAGRIENIEIITNPSVKYDAEGTAGIINIITKKGMGAGMSGIVNAMAGTGDKYNSDLNVNFTNDKLNVTIGAKWNDNKQFYNMDEIIETIKDGRKRRNDVDFYRHQTDKDFGGNMTLDYKLNLKNTLSYSAELGYTDFFINANFKYDEATENQPEHKFVYEDLYMGIMADYFTNNLSLTRHISDRKSWTNSVFYSKINYFFDDKQRRFETGSDFNSELTVPYYSMRYENDNFSTEIRAKTDYTETLENGSVFEAGGQYHRYHRYLDLNSETFDFDSNVWKPDPVFSNEFDFAEDIYSIYANCSGEKKGFTYSVGYRMEYTNRLIESFTLNEKYKYEKWNSFASLSVSKALGDDKQLAFNYSSRIDRPDEYFLNPFPDVSNEFQKAYGNPLLRPNLTESYELSYQKHFSKGMFSSQAYLRTTDDAFTQVIGSDQEGVMILTFGNISDDKEFGVENMVNLQANKWWSLNASFNVTGQNSKGEMNGEAFDRSAITFDTRIINSFTIGKNTSAQLMAFYFHDRIGNSIGNVSKFYWIDASVQHNILNNRISLTLQAKDIFNTNQMKFDIKRTDYRFYVHRKPEYPVIQFSVSYKFNNYKEKSNSVKTKLKLG